MAYFRPKDQVKTFGDPKPEKREKKKPTPIKSRSAKLTKNSRLYLEQRKIYLSIPGNEICFVEGCNKQANTVEHTKGRKGFADQHAREYDIPLLLDERFWKPCCLQHNLDFESDSELSKKYQLSQIHDGKKI